MDRGEANLVNFMMDFILQVHRNYLDYCKMTRKEFNAVLDKWANKNLFEKIDNMWSLNLNSLMHTITIINYGMEIFGLLKRIRISRIYN